MSENRRRIPSYRLHKPSGQARVIIGGVHIYLGRYGSPESWEKYHRLVARRISLGQNIADSASGNTRPNLTVNELILAYWNHARSYYVKHGRPTDEQAGIRSALRYLRRLYGGTLGSQFGPPNLKTVRQAMIDADLSRGVVNQYISRVRRMFRWGVENDLIPVGVYQSLMTVSGLRKGRTTARETPPVEPVPDEHFFATLPHMTEVVRSMVQFQRLTGCRPKDACLLRPCDVDTSGDVWCYEPATHKMEHHGRPHRIFIGPKAQAVLQPWLNRPSDAYCFSPKESAEESIAKRRRRRRPVGSSSNGKRKPKLAPGDHYKRYSYRQAVERACKRSGVPKWTPNRLRHSRATEIRKQFGLEAAQVTLGHATADVSQIYAERDLTLAVEIMRKIG